MIALFIIIFKRFSRLIVTLVIDGNDGPPDGGSVELIGSVNTSVYRF